MPCTRVGGANPAGHDSVSVKKKLIGKQQQEKGRRTVTISIRMTDAISVAAITNGYAVTETMSELINGTCVRHDYDGMGMGEGERRGGGFLKDGGRRWGMGRVRVTR